MQLYRVERNNPSNVMEELASGRLQLKVEGSASRSGLYTYSVPTEKIPRYQVFFGYWVYLLCTYLLDFCMGTYLIRTYLSNYLMGTSVGIHQLSVQRTSFTSPSHPNHRADTKGRINSKYIIMYCYF